MTSLGFEAFSSTVDVSFWYELAQQKLNKLKLSEEPLEVHGWYGISSANVGPRIFVDISSFSDENPTPKNNFTVKGFLLNLNVYDNFVQCDKQPVLERAAQRVWAAIEAGNMEEAVCSFGLLTFADLKKYDFYYWFVFPALSPPDSKKFVELSRVPIGDYMTQSNVTALSVQVATVMTPSVPVALYKKEGDQIILGRASEYDSFFGTHEPVFVLATSGSQSGWCLRNLLVYLKVNKKLKKATVIQLRADKSDINNITSSDVITVDLHEGEIAKEEFKATGWERNAKNKLSPRLIKLSTMMDKKALAASAVDLNLKLMRWRLLPNLQLEGVSGLKCLLLGAGTLGCNVARNLMSWGVRHLTFLDNGKISFSNPVRQWLYTFQDSCDGRMKATTAAERVKEIFPDIQSRGIEMAIPMPGHFIDENAVDECRKQVETMEALIDEHDVVFLLLDSREARWLPTVIATAKGKMCITSALGFDSYLCMRHGVHYHPDGEPVKKEEDEISLGCYFCNDVIAPANTMKDRTLDQQCTVTRPGLSSMASALAVELLVSMFHHPLKGMAPADLSSELSTRTSTELGNVPHQIRGFLAYFNTMLFQGHRYNSCVACSTHVVNEYKRDGFTFLHKVFNDPLYLEEITGLKKMKEEVDELEELTWDSDTEEFLNM